MGAQSSKNDIRKEEKISESSKIQFDFERSSSKKNSCSNISTTKPSIILNNNELDINNNNQKIYELNEREASAISYKNKIIGETIVKIEVSESKENTNTSELIIILDISESMGNYVSQILNDMIPKALDKLNYDETKKCHLITFSNESKLYHLTKKEFKSIGIKANGFTQMLGVIQNLKQTINSINSDEFINILSISDGKVQDRDNTNQNLELLLNEMKIKNKNINSQAIRFISSKGADPDTRLLCSLLKFNSSLHIQDNYLPITFDPKDEIMTEDTIEEFSDIIYKVFQTKKSGWRIISDSKNMRVEPFGEKYNQIELPEGKSVLFIDKALSELKDINLSSTSGESKKIIPGGEVNEDNSNEIYKETLKKIAGDVINNKIINTEKSNNENIELIQYVELLDKGSNTKFAEILKEIQNDKNVNDMGKDDIKVFIENKEKQFNDKLNEINEILKNKEEIIVNNFELFLILDSSSSMKNYINNLMQNVLYKAILNMGYNDEDKINIIGFCSEDVEETTFKLEKLKKHKIICSGERNLCDCLETLAKTIISKPNKRYILIFLFSGEIVDKENVRILAFKMLGLNHKIEIVSRVIKYINNDSDFARLSNKNKIDESKEDQITYGLIKQLNSRGTDSFRPLVIYENDPIEKQINDISRLIN